MQQADLQQIVSWFKGHVAAHLDLDPEGLKNIRLKELHTFKVLEAMEQLAAGEGLSAEETCIACAVALLHDAGRFPQYRRWRTFRDADSDNHARLGIDLIREQGVLDHLSQDERLLIEEAVRFHNQLTLPAQYQSSTDRYIRLIRDADKLDIWRVFVELLAQPAAERPSAACLDMPELDTVTLVCIQSLASGQIVRLEDCKVLHDFRLLQISWVYDLNTATTYRLLSRRGYLQALADGLPELPGLRSALAMAEEFVRHKAGQ